MIPLLGLRGRITAATVACGVATLAVATVALLSPLDRRLRDEAVSSLVTVGHNDLPGLRRALAHGTRSRAVRQVLHDTRRLAVAEVAVVDGAGIPRAGIDLDDNERFPEGGLAARTGHTVRAVVGNSDSREARVAVPIAGRDPRLALVLRKSLEDASAASAVVRNALTVAALAGVTVALLLGLLLARGLVRRLAALRETALRVAELGPVVEVAPDGARDEVGDLTRAFATMQRRLREQEEARRTFVATASHELRTPIASLRLILEGLAADLSSPAADLSDAHRQAIRADRQAGRLALLADELLTLSRIDAGVPLRRDLLELGELSRSVIAELAERAHAAAVSFDLEASEPTWAFADPTAAARVVRILLDNALRHAPRGTAVRVVVSTSSGRSRVVVSDSGPGVALAEREVIFDRFVRGRASGNDGGFGLGLAIGRELACGMSGELSLLPGDGGARFEFALEAVIAP